MLYFPRRRNVEESFTSGKKNQNQVSESINE